MSTLPPAVVQAKADIALEATRLRAALGQVREAGKANMRFDPNMLSAEVQQHEEIADSLSDLQQLQMLWAMHTLNIKQEGSGEDEENGAQRPQNPRVVQIAPRLPFFDSGSGSGRPPSSVDEFLDRLEETDEENRIRRTLSQLTGDRAARFRKLERSALTNGTEGTWTEFRVRFKEYFGAVETTFSLFKQKARENPRQFYVRILTTLDDSVTVARGAVASSRDLVDLAKTQFLNGLISSVRTRLDGAARELEIDELIARSTELWHEVRTTDDELGDVAAIQQPIKSAPAGSSEPQSVAEPNLRAELLEMQSSFSKLLANGFTELAKAMANQPQGNRNSDWKKNITCYNCNRKGHFKRDCRLPVQPSNKQEGERMIQEIIQALGDYKSPNSDKSLKE